MALMVIIIDQVRLGPLLFLLLKLVLEPGDASFTPTSLDLFVERQLSELEGLVAALKAATALSFRSLVQERLLAWVCRTWQLLG